MQLTDELLHSAPAIRNEKLFLRLHYVELCQYGLHGAYDYYVLARQVSRFVMVRVSAHGKCRV